MIFAFAFGKITSPFHSFSGILFGIISGDSLKGGVLQVSLRDVTCPLGDFLLVSRFQGRSGRNMDHFISILISIL